MAQPFPPSENGLTAQMENMSLDNSAGQLPAGRKTKRSARVFHTQFPGSENVQEVGQPSAVPSSGAPLYTPMDQPGPGPYGQQPSYFGNSPQAQQQTFASPAAGQFGQVPQSQFSQPTGQFNSTSVPDSQAFIPILQNSPSAEDIIPFVPKDREDAQKQLGAHPIFKTLETVCPPPSTADFDVLDQGNAGPQYARLSMYNVPSTEALRASTKIPLGMVLRPFAPHSNKEYEHSTVPVADFSNGIAPPRCQRCRTYMNPSMTFIEGGTKFTCNMCQFSNEVPPEYFQPIDVSNKRIDWLSRPELALGTYDMIVPKEYWKDEDVEPSPLCHLVLIDVSRSAIKKELPKLAVEALRSALYGDGLDAGEDSVSQFSNDESQPSQSAKIKYPAKAKIGIATYDRTVQFYNLSPKLEQAQMMVMSDIEDGFVPIEEGLFVDPEESRYVIEDLLDRIDVLFEDTPYDEPVYGCALNVALQATKQTGGKVSAILSSLPSRGPGSLVVREGTLNFMGEKEVDLFAPDNKYYKDLGMEYAKAGVGLDLFLFPNSNCDLANSGAVCQLSGGHEHFYPNFVPQRDGRKFISQFCKTCQGEIATQAQLKVRTSPGLQVAAYYGNFYHENLEDDPVFGNIDSHSTLGLLFQYDGKLEEKYNAHFQSALLYTSSDGQRRVRVSNLVARVTDQFRNVMNFVDLDAVMGIITRDSIARTSESSRRVIRDRINERIIDVFASYRQHIGSSFPANQLLVPLTLRNFIAQCLALQRSLPLREQQIVSDPRIHFGRLMKSLSASELSLFLYPRIIGLHNLQPHDCKYTENGLFNMPTNVKASKSALDVGGVYLTYNGQNILLWVHKQVSPLLLKDLFGEYAVNVESLDPYMNELPELDTEVSSQARALVKYFSNQSSMSFLGIQLAREGLDGSDYEFQSYMAEDRLFDHFGYVDYMANVHRLVQTKLEKSKEKKSNFLSDYF